MRAVRCLVVISLVWAVAVASALAGGRRNDAPAAYRDRVVLMAFVDGVPDARQRAILAGVHAVETERIGVGVRVLRVRRGRVLQATRRLKAHPEVRYAEPDFVHEVDGALPDDPNVTSQWAVRNTGQKVNGVTGTAGADQRSLAAWSVTTGTNAVVVAVLDTGVQYSHPDLVTNMWTNPGGLGGCPAGTHGYNVLTRTCDPMDDDANYGGHGTHVAGIIGATGNDAAGVAGVNWTTSIMAVKWVDGHDTAGSSSNLIAAMDWVVMAKRAGVNVRVANDSATWPGTAFSHAVSDEIDLLGANDILFVTAAGNTAQNNDSVPRYPCSYNRPNMICVAASDQNDRLWSSSNRGVSTVKLAAPGVNVVSTLRLSNYGYVSGTSMASPQVCGTAALILSLGYQSVAGVRSMILSNVDTLPSLAGLVATGGRLNVCKAVPGCSSGSSGTPANSAPPMVTGIPQLGSIVGASTGTWSGVPTSYSYQWYRCSSSACSAISGATGQSYGVLAAADIGAMLAVTVTASNATGSSSVAGGASVAAAAASSPFAIGSTVHDGDTLGDSLKWQATPSPAVNFVQFYVDGVLSQTVTSTSYTYNKGTTGLLDTTTLPNGTHVLGLRALASDNRTYGFYGATVTVANSSHGTLPPTTTTTSSSSTSISATSTTATSTITTTTTPGAGGGIALVQSGAGGGSGVGSLSVAFPSGNAAGNLIIAFVRMSTSSQTVTITDRTGNVYTDAVAQAQTTDGHQVHVFFAKNVAGGPNTVTATFSASNNHPWLAIYEYRGLSATSPLDRTARAQGTSTMASSGATAATAAPNELLFAATGMPASYTGTATAGAGYAMQRQDTSTSRAATATGVTSSAGSYSGTFSLSASTNWSAVFATFAAASSPTTSTLPSTSTTAPTTTTSSTTTSSTTTSSTTETTTSTTAATTSSTLEPSTTTTTSTAPTTSTPTTSTPTSTTTTTPTTSTSLPMGGVNTYQAGLSGPIDSANVDTNMRLSMATTSFGTDPDLYVGVTNASDKVYRTVMAFDLSDIPAGATISTCSLTVNVTQRTSPTAGHVRRLCGEHWLDGAGQSETQATWSTWKSGTPWTVAGAGSTVDCAAGGDYTTTDEVGYIPPAGTGPFTFPELSALCQDALANRGGWLRLRISQDAESTQSNLIRLDSSEATTATHRPMLSVMWSPAAMVSTTTSTTLGP